MTLPTCRLGHTRLTTNATNGSDFDTFNIRHHQTYNRTVFYILRLFPPSKFRPSALTLHLRLDNQSTSAIMSNPLDSEAGSELFSSYEAELKLVQADLLQKLDQIPELSGESRKSAVSQAERALEEADELVRRPPIILQQIPTDG